MGEAIQGGDILLRKEDIMDGPLLNFSDRDGPGPTFCGPGPGLG